MTTKRKVLQPPTAAEPDGAVERFLASSDHPLKPVVAALRRLILGLDPRIREEIKWNAPSFFINEHFATFRLGPPSANAAQQANEPAVAQARVLVGEHLDLSV